MPTDIPDSQLARRARDYWSADGIPILVGAVLYLGVVGLFLILFYLVNHIRSLTGNWIVDSFVGTLLALLVMTSPFWITAAII